jgi:hypothetical protein
MSTYIIDHKKYNKIPKFMTLWRGYGRLSAKESLEKLFDILGGYDVRS